MATLSSRLTYLIIIFALIPRINEAYAVVEPHSYIEKDDTSVSNSDINKQVVSNRRHDFKDHHRERDDIYDDQGKNKTLFEDADDMKSKVVDDDMQTESNPTPDCPKCREKELKIESFKQRLLQKLELSSPPKVKGPLPRLPFDFYVGEDFAMSDEPTDKFDVKSTVQTKKIFVFGKDITHYCAKKKGVGCYSFDVSNKTVDPDQVSSVELWIYKQRDVNDHHLQTFMVSELEPYEKHGKSFLRSRNIVKRIETRLKYGWMKIYVRRSVSRWLSKPHRNHGLSVICKTCQRKNHKAIYGNKEGYMPILVFYMKDQQRLRQRTRRYSDCDDETENCCHVEPLIFNFHEHGWDYIMEPKQIAINYCTGSCKGITAAYHNHTKIIQTMKHTPGDQYDMLKPCCSPVSFGSDQSLLYMGHDGKERLVQVSELTVRDCGCT
ncbi:hypothetical protein ACF0H5_004484 [Mactra antiquata]